MDKNADLVSQASQFAETSSKGLTTFYGQPVLEQSLEMAKIIHDLKLDPEAVAAAILTSVVQHTRTNTEIIKEKFGENIANLVSSFQQMSAINNLVNATRERDQTQKDRLRKILLAMASDIRVVLIKLAERICIMRGIEKINSAERKHLAEETRDIFAPLANRLGVGQIKTELEDLAFHYIDSVTFQKINDYLAESKDQREARIQQVILLLKKQLSNAHIKADINGRAKHIYSIFLKMQKKHTDFKNIYDHSAIRVLVPTIEDCYKTLSIVHELWTPVPEEFDDYIANPKPNGYRSIHTAVIDEDGKNLEIQIRTTEMHDAAEHGVAAHWIYKENKKNHSGYEEKISFLRQLLAWHKDVSKEEKPLQKTFLEDRVYVFTPAGDILDLPVGATPIDFAYQIHTTLGHRCRGAKINGHIVPLTHALQTGDQIDIITAKEGAPSRDWLNPEYVKTSGALSKIKRWFRQQETHEIDEVKKIPEKKISRAPAKKIIIKKTMPVKSSLHISGTEDLLTRFAKCCNPTPKDNIMGYITQGRGVSIHKDTCQNISNSTNLNKNRLISVTWDIKKK
jgi:GTP pyrophosphokinase